MGQKFFKTDLTEIKQFAIPILFEQISIMLTPFVSSFISRDIGTIAVSAVNLVEQMNSLTSNVFGAIAVGATVIVSQYRGKKDPEAAGNAGFQAMKLSLLLAIMTSLGLGLFSAPIISAFLGDKAYGDLFYYTASYFAASIFSYPLGAIYSSAAAVLRGAGQTGVSLVGTLVKNLTYITVGLTLVNRLDMGIKGTGTALVASNLAGMLVMLAMLPKCRAENIVFPKFSLKLDKTLLAPLVRVSVPICVEQVLFSSGKLMTQRFAVGMGETELSVNSIANIFEGIFDIPGIALNSVAMALVGKRIGAKDFRGARDLVLDLMKMASIAMALSFFAWLPFMGSFFRLYTDDPEIISSLWRMILLSSAACPFLWPRAFTLSNAIKGAGDVKFTSAVRLFTVYCFRVVFSYILGVRLGLGALGIWSGMVIDWLVSSIIFSLRFKSARWLTKGI